LRIANFQFAIFNSQFSIDCSERSDAPEILSPRAKTASRATANPGQPDWLPGFE
jgi:hypothetical protein